MTCLLLHDAKMWLVHNRTSFTTNPISLEKMTSQSYEYDVILDEAPWRIMRQLFRIYIISYEYVQAVCVKGRVGKV